ncbi:MAG: GIY-YIG nuclease family protein [Alkalinema sp. RU_4_3]|nr:GIY-YIG nuclease family protein [Alkalinema sp. RU_4_3]
MVRNYRTIIYIDRDPNDPAKGWGWVEVNNEDVKRFGIEVVQPSSRTVTKRKWRYDEKTDSVYEDYDHDHRINPPARGRTGGKKFTLNLDGELVTIKVQKSLTIQAICTWIKTWASPNAKLITPGNRAHSLDGEKLAHQAHFIYFILNEDSDAIKIGRAKDLAKRMNALQTSSPAKLKLIKSVQVEGVKEAHELEQSLHRQFHEIRLAGEWFKAEANLLEYINQL